MRRGFWKRLLAALLAAAALTAAAALGWFDSLDGTASDAFYQRAGAADGEVVVIGMDQRASDALGPMPWPRTVMAEAIEYLNNADPDCRPAVIGIDVLYVGESADPDADEYLAAVAADGGNVVVAGAATFGSELVVDGDRFYMDNRAVLAWDAPYDALAEGAGLGHINAMADGDGVLRHALLYIDVPGVGRVYSFARTIYERWCAATGAAPNPAPETDGGFFYLPFTAGARGYYDEVSIVDLLDGTIEPDYFADKIVLIGPYAAGMQDEYRTSVDHAVPMYGIEFQANQIDAFRAGFFPRAVGRGVQLAVLFAVCALMLLFLIDRRVRFALLGWLGVCLGWLGLCFACYRGGRILHVLWVPLCVTVLLIAAVADNYVRAQRERRRVTNTFGHYVDPAVMRQLLEQGSGALELGCTISRCSSSISAASRP